MTNEPLTKRATMKINGVRIPSDPAFMLLHKIGQQFYKGSIKTDCDGIIEAISGTTE